MQRQPELRMPTADQMQATLMDMGFGANRAVRALRAGLRGVLARLTRSSRLICLFLSLIISNKNGKWKME